MLPSWARKHILTHLRVSKRTSWQHLSVVYMQMQMTNYYSSCAQVLTFKVHISITILRPPTFRMTQDASFRPRFRPPAWGSSYHEPPQ